MSKRLVIGISGASGMPYVLRLLQVLPAELELHIVASKVACQVMRYEQQVELSLDGLKPYLPDRRKAENTKLYAEENHFAPIASGSFKTDGMVIMPCSVKTLAGVANGYASSLLERAADVTLKEKRPLVLVVRETPLSQIHLKNMLSVSRAGGTILPASPGFYHRPQEINDLLDFIVARTLEALHLPQNLIKGWKES